MSKLSIAWLLIASPVLANGPGPAGSATGDPPEQEYTIKKVCRTVEVAGSSIPRRICVNKKIPVKKSDAKSEADVNPPSGPAAEASKDQ